MTGCGRVLPHRMLPSVAACNRLLLHGCALLQERAASRAQQLAQAFHEALLEAKQIAQLREARLTQAAERSDARVASVQVRCGRDAGAMRARCGRDARCDGNPCSREC